MEHAVIQLADSPWPNVNFTWAEKFLLASKYQREIVWGESQNLIFFSFSIDILPSFLKYPVILEIILNDISSNVIKKKKKEAFWKLTPVT